MTLHLSTGIIHTGAEAKVARDPRVVQLEAEVRAARDPREVEAGGPRVVKVKVARQASGVTTVASMDTMQHSAGLLGTLHTSPYWQKRHCTCFIAN